MSDCVRGIIDVGGNDISEATKLYLSNGPVVAYNAEQAGQVDPLTVNSFFQDSLLPLVAWSARSNLFRFGDELYMYLNGNTDGQALYRMGTSTVGGVSTTSFSRVLQVSNINTAVEFQGSLWMAEGSGGSGRVYSWDGATLTTDITGVLTGDMIIAKYREDVIVWGTNTAKRRNGGAWSSITMPGGLTSFKARAAAVFKDKLYVGGIDEVGGAGGAWVPRILVWDGTSCTIARSLASGSVANNNLEGVLALTVAFGQLFFAWSDTSATAGRGIIGSYDGTTWTDTVKNLFSTPSTVSPPTANIMAVASLQEYRGFLFAGPVRVQDAVPMLPVYADSNGLTGTWTQLTDEDAQGIYDMAVF